MKRITLLLLIAGAPVMAAQPIAVPSPTPAAAAAPPTGQAPVAASAPAPTTGAADALQPAVNTSPATAAVPTKSAIAPAARPGGRKAQDRLELGATQITGNQELPKVMYVVPWKRSDLGDLTGRPANSLLDEVLAPVDRDVFQRQNRYYDALRPDTGSTGSGAAQP